MRRAQRLLSDFRGVWRTADRNLASRWTVAAVRYSPAIVRTKTLVPADRAVAARQGEFHINGSTVKLPGEHFSGAREMYCRDVYRFRDPEFGPRPGMSAVDLGANVGLFSLYAAVAGARVLAVEAQSGFAPTFHELMSRNGVTERVQLHQALVGSGTGVFADAGRRMSATHWGTEPETSEIGALLGAHGFDHVDLIKIDIEGSEYELFAEPAWLSRVDRVVMEAHDGFGQPEDLVSTLEGAGFSVQRANADLQPVERLVETGLLYASRPSTRSGR